MVEKKKPDVRVLGARISAELADRLRRYCRDNAGKPRYYTVNRFVEEAIGAHLATLESEASETPAVNRTDPSRNGLLAGRHR
jgi:hypothetical protein